MANTYADTNTRPSFSDLPSLRTSLAPAQSEQPSGYVRQPEVQKSVLGQGAKGQADCLSGERVRHLIATRTRRRNFSNVQRSVNPRSPYHIAERLANGLDAAVDGSCWEWVLSKNKCGYGTIGMFGKVFIAHRVAYELTHGELPIGLLVLHSCDNPACINPDHLHLGTDRDNSREMDERGRRNVMRGEEHPLSKLTTADVLEIRRLSDLGVGQVKIGAMFGVHHSQVSDIKHRRIWKHVKT